MLKKTIVFSLFSVLGLLFVSNVSSAASSKVKVCHYTNSDTNEIVIIDIADAALQSHIDHGDQILPEGESDCSGGGPNPV